MIREANTNGEGREDPKDRSPTLTFGLQMQLVGIRHILFFAGFKKKNILYWSIAD